MRTPAWAALPLLAIALTGCGGDAADNQVIGDTLNVYVSLPLQGPQARRSQAIVNGVKLALSDADGAVGELKVNVVFLDDSRGRPGRWNAAEAADNARKAAEDSRSVGYIGELDTAATRFSLPITNQASILHVAPAPGAAGLTRAGPGAEPGEPDLYYPTGRRTFGRVAPIDDDVQARALPGNKAFIASYRREFGSPPDLCAAYGYESLAVILDSIRRAGEEGRDRRHIIKAFFETQHRRSILGTYSIDEGGDSTLKKVAGYGSRSVC